MLALKLRLMNTETTIKPMQPLKRH